MITPASLRRSSTRCHSSPQAPDFPRTLNGLLLRPEQPFSGRVSPHASSPRIHTRCWNMNQLPIDYAFPPHLRGRHDLYPGNLRFSADGNLTRLFVYLYLHSLFHPLQLPSRVTFSGPWNAPLPSDDYSPNPKLRYTA